MTIRYVLRADLAIMQGRYADVVDSSEIVNDFLNLFWDPAFSGTAIVLNSPDLRNKKAFGMTRATPYLELSAAPRDRNAILEACTRSGHLSVFFFPRQPSLFLDTFYKHGYYSHIDEEGEIDTVAQIPALSVEAADALDRFLAEIADPGLDVACAFSHDADLFYELHFSGVSELSET
jgi:hypothetical protein